MSWFFGKKKNKESPVKSADEAPTTHADDYVIIEKQANPFDPSSISPSVDSLNSSNGSLYPYLGGGMSNIPPTPATMSQSGGVNDSHSYLSGIPFRLDKMYENNGEIDRIHIDEIFSFVLRVKSMEYDYDFSLENSVITEMEASSE